jgi:hypothetical protein
MSKVQNGQMVPTLRYHHYYHLSPLDLQQRDAEHVAQKMLYRRPRARIHRTWLQRPQLHYRGSPQRSNNMSKANKLESARQMNLSSIKLRAPISAVEHAES